MMVWNRIPGAASVDALLKCAGIGRLGRGALVVSAGYLFRALALAGYLVLASRWLGAAGYGLFAGFLAGAMLLGTVSGWGAAQVLTQRVSSGRDTMPGAMRSAIARTIGSGGLSCACVLLALVVLGNPGFPWAALVLLGVSELILFPVVQVAVSACMVAGQGVLSAVALCSVPLGRLLLLVGVVATDVAGHMAEMAWVHFGGTLFGVVVCMLVVTPFTEWRTCPGVGFSRDDVREAAPYAIGMLVASAYLEIDKVLLLGQLGAAALGPYAAAFRVAVMTALPIFALAGVALPRLIEGAGNPAGSRLFRRLLLVSAGYGILACCALWVVAPALPWVFGEEFASSRDYLLLLAPWPLLFAIHQALGIGLTASGRQGKRVLVELIGLATVVAACLALVNVLGARAAAFGLLAAELLMIVISALMLHAVHRFARHYA